MKILLLYPQPAHNPKSRLSRTDAQLEGISNAVRDLLRSVKNKDLTVTEIGIENNTADGTVQPAANRSKLQAEFRNVDLIIDVSLVPDVNVCQGDFAGPVIHLSPAFPGSFTCNDITIQGRGRLQQGDIVNSIGSSRDPYVDMLPSTHELDADMHYAAFSALPARIGNAFYRNDRDHALILLSYPEHLRNEKVLNDDIETLANVLHSVENLRSLTFVCESLADVSMIQEVADALKDSLRVQASIWGLRKGEFHDMFSIMAKANVVLFGGSSLYADAVIRGIPAYPWRTTQPGTEGIAEAYNDFTENKDYPALLINQRKHLERLFDAQYFDATVPNLRECFEKVMIDIMQDAVHSCKFPEAKPVEDQPDWVISPARLTANAESEKASRSVWRDRQSMLKFRQALNRPVVRRGKKAILTQSN